MSQQGLGHRPEFGGLTEHSPTSGLFLTLNQEAASQRKSIKDPRGSLS